ADDLLVGRHEIVPAHARRARLARGDHDHLRALGLRVAVRPDDVRLVAEHGSRLIDVECLALGQVLDDVDENDVRVVPPRQLLRDRGADRTGSDDRHLAPAHTRTPSFSITASATSLVPTAVGSSRVGFMSYVTLCPSAITS